MEFYIHVCIFALLIKILCDKEENQIRKYEMRQPQPLPWLTNQVNIKNHTCTQNNRSIITTNDNLKVYRLMKKDSDLILQYDTKASQETTYR